MAQEVYIQGLPDVIAFPDNWSQEDISDYIETDQFKREAYQQFGKVVMTNNDAEDWQITKGIKSGGAALGTGLAGSIAAFGVKVGSPEIVDWAKEQLADYQMKRLVHQGKNTTLESIGSESVADFLASPDQWDSFINWGLFNFGNAASTTLPTILAAGLSITPAAPLAVPFMLGYGAMMGAGEGFSSAIGENLTDEEAANIALGVMVPHAALEMLPGSTFIRGFKGALTSGGRLANQVIKTTKREGIKAGAGQALKKAPTFVRAMAAGFGKGAVAEGLTEGGQEGLIEGTVQTVAGNHNVFKDPAFWKQLGEAAAAGAVGGGPLTAATAGLGHLRQKRRTKELDDLMESLKGAALKEEEGDHEPGSLRNANELTLDEIFEEMKDLEGSTASEDIARLKELVAAQNRKREEAASKGQEQADLGDIPFDTGPVTAPIDEAEIEPVQVPTDERGQEAVTSRSSPGPASCSAGPCPLI